MAFRPTPNTKTAVTAKQGAPWRTQGNAERMLERLDRIARDVELCLSAVEEFLGIEGAATEEDVSDEGSDSETESKAS